MELDLEQQWVEVEVSCEAIEWVDWQSPDVESAKEFFAFWYGRVIRSRISQLKTVAKMLRSHLERLLNYIIHPITNAVTEGFNSKIQALRHAARGFRSFAN